jgi:hypothetical protein
MDSNQQTFVWSGSFTMAFLFTAEFLTGADGQPVEDGSKMLDKVKQALKNITGSGGKQTTTKDLGYDRVGIEYWSPPLKLRQNRDCLRDEWRDIWRKCTIEFDGEERGASIHVPTRRIRIGPFFLQSRFAARDFEKIILHEFLHAAFSFGMREADHGMMEQVLIFNIGYHPPANPAECD